MAVVLAGPFRSPQPITRTELVLASAEKPSLFRKALEAGAAANDARCWTFPERQIENLAISRLWLSSGVLRGRLAEFGQRLGRPWRADEKAAAMAAWLALHATEAG